MIAAPHQAPGIETTVVGVPEIVDTTLRRMADAEAMLQACYSDADAPGIDALASDISIFSRTINVMSANGRFSFESEHSV
jgi:hypothetical protein